MKAMTFKLATERGMESRPIAELSKDACLPAFVHPSPRVADRSLYTATLMFERDGEEVVIFHASYASSRAEMIETLGTRVPHRRLGMVKIRTGLDPDDAIIRRLVPTASVAALTECGDLCPIRRPLRDGGILHIVENVQISDAPAA